jgi:c-di-GMP-binding flagellar brake protein YcgR
MGERRNEHRIDAQEHETGYNYSTELDGKCYKVRLLDVSKGGARFLFKDKPEIDLHGKVGQMKDDSENLPFMEGMSYSVAWAMENMMGVSFSNPLTWAYETLFEYCRYAWCPR